MIAALLLAPILIMGRIGYDPELIIDPKDPNLEELQAYQEKLRRNYDKGEASLPKFKDWRIVNSESAKAQFPKLTFYSISWSEVRHPKCGNKLVSLCGHLETTLAIDNDTGKLKKTLFCYGNYEAFGELLVNHKIEIQNLSDAQTVWNAFCDVHQKRWKKNPSRKGDTGEWQIGISTSEQVVSATETTEEVVHRKYYKLVEVAPEDGRILSWKSTVITSEKKTRSKEG